MVKVLVTGAGGFVGMALTEHLIAHGYSVRAMVRNPEHVAQVENLGAEAVIADLNDRGSLCKAVSGIGQVFHIAALFRQAGLPPSMFYRVNVEGTRNLLDCAIEAGVQKIIHCSTVGVHGNIERPPATEDTPYNPGDPYQESKVEGEKLFLDYVSSGKIKGSVIRPAMIYGPNDTRTLKLFKGIAAGRFFYVGPGNALVHFVDVRDLAVSFRLAGECEGINGEVFIVAGETSLPLQDLACLISSLLGVSEPWLHLPVKPMQMLGTLCETICTPLHVNPPIFRRRVDFFTKNRNFDCTKARRVLGFRPSKTLTEELVEIVDSYLKAGQIDRSRIKKPSVMLRSFDGEIHSWDEDSRKVYGWSQEQAVGANSHALLATDFPLELEHINSRLEKEGFWRGNLIHRCKEGRLIKTLSTWRLIKPHHEAQPKVLELNLPLSRLRCSPIA